ncbi:MAG: hypothetical protein Q4C77_04770 [Eubacteriales bacterium]|nr:hypothetical protein [Eubacteriales bacterium]
MGKLMKYEFRKTRMSRLILLLVTLLSEILFLAGLFIEWEDGIFWGILLLTLCASFGIFYLGIESILVFSKDMNSKQSYMLFMTPQNSYRILGAKVLENLISIIAAGFLFGLIAFADASLAIIRLDGLNQLVERLHYILKSMFQDLPSWPEVAAAVALVLLGWFMTITIGYLAVTLSATVLAGKRFSGLISFVLFLVISWLVEVIMRYLPNFQTLTMDYILEYTVTLLFSAAFYLISGWILERKLSL